MRFLYILFAYLLSPVWLGSMALRGFRDRFYCVGMSPESVEQAAALGARLMIFSQQTWEMFATGSLRQYREAWRKHHSGEPAPPLDSAASLTISSTQTAQMKGQIT